MIVLEVKIYWFTSSTKHVECVHNVKGEVQLSGILPLLPWYCCLMSRTWCHWTTTFANKSHMKKLAAPIVVGPYEDSLLSNNKQPSDLDWIFYWRLRSTVFLMYDFKNNDKSSLTWMLSSIGNSSEWLSAGCISTGGESEFCTDVILSSGSQMWFSILPSRAVPKQIMTLFCQAVQVVLNPE